MLTRWGLVVSDFRREYALPGDELIELGRDEFLRLLGGLSRHSRWREAWDRAPKHVYEPADIAAITAAARR